MREIKILVCETHGHFRKALKFQYCPYCGHILKEKTIMQGITPKLRGYRCNACGYKTKSRGDMEQHYSFKHGITCAEQDRITHKDRLYEKIIQ